MDVKEFLLTNKAINRSEISRLMFPKNKTGAMNYLTSKLNGLDNRTFTRKDALNAKKVLEQIGLEIANITIADSY